MLFHLWMDRFEPGASAKDAFPSIQRVLWIELRQALRIVRGDSAHEIPDHPGPAQPIALDPGSNIRLRRLAAHGFAYFTHVPVLHASPAALSLAP